MITIPMQVSNEVTVVPMSVGSDGQTVSMIIGAEYAVVGAEAYTGVYEVIPKANESQTLETTNKLLEQDVTIFSVPYFQTSNEYGDTVYIASEV